MMKHNSNTMIKGFILPASIFFMFASIAIVMAYFTWLNSKVNELEYRIAVTKATYNAESGVAEKAYPYLLLSTFEKDTILKGRTLEVTDDSSPIEMGSYRQVKMDFNLNTSERNGAAIGVATWGTGDQDTVFRTSRISAIPESLGKYMYFTDSEKAGGAPFSFGPPNGWAIGERRGVTFYYDDELDGHVQTNGQIYFSTAGGCADFSNATWLLTYGNPGPATWGGCSQQWNGLWQGQEVDTLSSCPLQFPPPGYLTMKNNASIIYDSGRKIGGGSKDTLIMTDIEFLEDGRFNVKQWWYLMPPHLRPNISVNARTSPYPQHLDGAEDYIVNIENFNYFDDKDNGFPILEDFCHIPADADEEININTCKPYLDSLRSYHAVYYTNPFSDEQYMDPTASASHGIRGQHFDFQPLDYDGNVDITSLLIDEQRSSSNPIVIYIKDGPVRVHGSYKGRYSIVTDEFTAYRRHAWNDSLSGQIPIDTIWNNIWLTDDLINADTFGDGNMQDIQPNDACRGGSSNSMGLVSGANIVVANTRANGAINGCTQADGNCNQDISGIRINAGMIALNESFVTHYWQNTTHDADFNNQPINLYNGGSIVQNYNPPASGYWNTYWNGENDSDYRRWEDYPPWGDSRGRVKAADLGFNNPPRNYDSRGEIYLWGGVVQKFRGYVQRNPTSPYEQATIGYQSKDYHYDANLRCNPPPFYPYIECQNSNGELVVRLTSATTGKN